MGPNRLLNGKDEVVYVFLIATIVLSAPIMVRMYFEGNLLSGNEPYYHEKAANEIIESGLELKRDLGHGLYHPLIAGVGYFTGVRAASMLMPLLFGISSLVMFYFILKRFGLAPQMRMIAVSLAAISPPFIHTFATSNQYSLTILLAILGFYFAILRRSAATIASVFFFMLAIPSILFSSQEIAIKPEMRFLVDLGSVTGFSLFALILAAIGFYALWRKKQGLFSLYILTIFFAIASVFFPSANLYLNFPISVFAAFGFGLLAETRWDIGMIKNLTLILVACGLVFSTLSYAERFVNSEPKKEIAMSLEWLKTRPEGNILSHPKNGFWIEDISGKSALADDYTKDSELLNDTNAIFRSRSIERIKPLMEKYGIRYVWIDKKMKETVWKREDDGLLFLFKDTTTFKNIYRTNEVEIWEYTK